METGIRRSVVAGKKRLDPATAGTVSFLIRLVLLGLALLIALRYAGVDPRTLAVGGAFTAVVVGLAAQNTLGNVLAGLILLSARPFKVGDRTYDDGYRGVKGPFVLEGGGRRIEVTFEEGYPYAQVFAPEGQELICFEPMTAPTNALTTGDGLPWIQPGESYTAAFRIGVH